MFISRTKYEIEKACAKYRIEQLEKIICPHGHSYKKIGEKTVAFDTLFGHDLTTPIYKCTKCGKEKSEE